MIASLTFPYVTNKLFALCIATLSPIWVGAISFGLSKVVSGHKVSSFILGGLIVGIFGSWLGDVLSGKNWTGAPLAFTYGMLTGAAAACYFADRNKHTTLFQGLLTTSLFVVCIGSFTGIGVVTEGGWYSSSFNTFMTLYVGFCFVLVFYSRKLTLRLRRPKVFTDETDAELFGDGETDEGMPPEGEGLDSEEHPRGWGDAVEASEDAPASSESTLEDDSPDTNEPAPKAARRPRRQWMAASVVVVLLVGFILWWRPEFLPFARPSSSKSEVVEKPTIQTRDGDKYSITLNGCQKEYFNSEYHVTCQFYFHNTTDLDYRFKLKPSNSIAIDELGVDHVTLSGQISEDPLSNSPEKNVPRQSRVVGMLIFDDLRKFKSPNLSLLRISIEIARQVETVEFRDVKITNWRADVSWLDKIFGL